MAEAVGHPCGLSGDGNGDRASVVGWEWEDSSPEKGASKETARADLEVEQVITLREGVVADLSGSEESGGK